MPTTTLSFDSTPLQSIDPRNGALVGTVPVTSAAELDAVCRKAGALFDAEQLAPSFEPARLLVTLADSLDSNREELLRLADAETALGSARLTGELARTTFQLRAFAELVGTALLTQPLVDTADPARVPPRAEQRRSAVPLGPVAVFSASNFPFAFGLLGGDTASALAVGCPVVAKGHPAQPLLSQFTGELASRAVLDAGAPDGWLSVVHGASAELGLALVSHPNINACGFTGSQRAGTALVAAGAARAVPIPVFAEMGSLNPVFVGPVATNSRLDDLADAWAGTLIAGSGQLCTKPNLILLVGEAAADRLATRAAARLAEADLIPLLAPRLRDGFTAAVEAVASAPGVRRLGLPTADADARPGNWAEGAVLMVDGAEVVAHPELVEEMFGPAGMVVACADQDELLAVAGALPGSLTASLMADEADLDWARSLLSTVRQRAGRLVYNGWPTGVSVGLATVHGGPWPATSAPATTSVGFTAAWRFTRPVAYQGFPEALLPRELRS